MRVAHLLWTALCSLSLLAGACTPHRTGVTEVGVKFNKVTKSLDTYPPGATYFFMPILNDWKTYDVRQRNLVMTAQASEGDREGICQGSLRNHVQLNTEVHARHLIDVGDHRVEFIEIGFHRIDRFFVSRELEQSRCVAASHSRDGRIFPCHKRTLLLVATRKEKRRWRRRQPLDSSGTSIPTSAAVPGGSEKSRVC